MMAEDRDAVPQARPHRITPATLSPGEGALLRAFCAWLRDDGLAICVSNEEWIQWAHPVWYDVRESHTLNGHPAREQSDERHICPLQLDTIARCIRLWSNPGETCFDPFAGVGSTLFQAVTLGRTGLGCELKKSYFDTAAKYLREAEAARHQPTLFDGLEPLPASASSTTTGAAR